MVNPNLPSNNKSTTLPKTSYRHPSKTFSPSLLPSKIDLRSAVSAINFSANPLSSEQYTSKSFKKSNVNKCSLDLLKLLLVYCSEESGLAEKLIADAADLKSILDGKRDGIKVFEGWRYDVFGKDVDLLLEGKLGFTIENYKVKKINF